MGGLLGDTYKYNEADFEFLLLLLLFPIAIFASVRGVRRMVETAFVEREVGMKVGEWIKKRKKGDEKRNEEKSEV